MQADELALVGIQEVESKQLTAELWQVTVIVENRKLSPTHSARDLKAKITPPDVVSISGEGKVIVGLLSEDQFFDRTARSEASSRASRACRDLPGNSVRYVRWLVTGKGPWRVELKSVKGGSDKKEVTRK